LDPIRKLLTVAWLIFLGAFAGCASGPIVAREVLSDPTMRFGPTRPVDGLGMDAPGPDDPLPPDTVTTRMRIEADPGKQVDGTWLESSTRASAEIAGGFGVEAGYGVAYRKQLIQKLDGYTGPIDDQAVSHGPDAALVLDDGTSLLRAGYRLRMAWDGWLHEPSFGARTTVLGRDTVLLLGYRRSMRSVTISADHLPARNAVDDDYTVDQLFAACEQGFLPGWNLRLDISARLEDGFLQSPYRLVSLFSGHPETNAPGVPRTEPEKHPRSRVRFGAMFRLRRMIQTLSAAIELGAGYGSGSWRVEHQTIEVSYLQRIGDSLIMSAAGGAYHQTRAIFYRDDYPDGPLGAYWSADRELSSYIAWWTRLGLSWMTFPRHGRLLAMFKYITLSASIRALHADYGWEGADSPNGFSSYESLASSERKVFSGGWNFGGWFAFEGGF
jgi:hypothetical protein